MNFDKNVLENDKDIKTINVNNLQDRPDSVRIIGDLEESKSRKLTKNIIFITTGVLITALIVATIYISINFRFVQGKVVDAQAQIAGFSMVSINYNASYMIEQGSLIYYSEDTSTDQPFIAFSNTYKIGTVEKINNNYVTIKNGDTKATRINRTQVKYLLEN